MAEAAKQSGIALEKAYHYILWLMPTVEKFPRSQKFLLGDRKQGAALDILEGLVEATYTRNRLPVLHASTSNWSNCRPDGDPAGRSRKDRRSAQMGSLRQARLYDAVQRRRLSRDLGLRWVRWRRIGGGLSPSPSTSRPCSVLTMAFEKATPFRGQRPGLVMA
jgi:hypothetical protein